MASLVADREKEERLRMELEREKRQLEEERRRTEEEELARQLKAEELEQELACKRQRLPVEPAAGEELKTVTLLVRMPDGSRRGRRFRHSDKLQALFDFVDVSGLVQPGSYRLIRQYPRRALTEAELSFTLEELGLTVSKQEAFFLEVTA
eukprot:TRINITY_DN4709_c0_g1_i1.p1 TRINITY_DN4709_c0_g1~~TRINITY_DN4709_c0_g1_i1.p1  ORF type:complete len:150 (+),score=52.55 TRINITY_DN4709_c0_g1_i1:2-451(+)